MFSAKGTVNIHPERMAKRLNARRNTALLLLANAIVKDTNQFVPMDTGALAKSPRQVKQVGKQNGGVRKIIYDMPYARKLYYGITFVFSRDMHPKATHHWFEKAKSIYLPHWLSLVKKIMGAR